MKCQTRVVMVDRTKVRIKDLFLQRNLPHLLLLLQHLQHDRHLRRLGVFNQQHQHLLLQHQGENT